MKVLEVDPGWNSRKSPLPYVAMIVLSLLCGAWTYHVTLNAFDWRQSAERAREIIGSPAFSDKERCDALYVLMRHEKEDAEVIKRLALVEGPIKEHFTNAVQLGRECWK